ncbi:MAG: hypothetical protein FWD41_03060 [Actinomycetia bacterium]|nr:hypothetical protein [Actinomycetes bacterium]
MSETVLKVGSTTFTNANLKDVATVVAHGAAGNPLFGRKKASAASKNLAEGGTAILTNQRFVFGKGKNIKKMAEGSVADFSGAAAKGEIRHEIPLGSILAINQGKQGLSPVLDLVTDTGTYRFSWMQKALLEWEAAIESAKAQCE